MTTSNLKEGLLEIVVDITKKETLNTNFEFWSHDSNTASIVLNFKKNSEVIPIGCGSVVRVIMRFLVDGQQKFYVVKLDIINGVDGIARFNIPTDILGYSGEVYCGAFIDFSDDRSIDAGYFTFRLNKSMIDGDFEELDELYVKEFDEAVKKIKIIADEYEEKYATLIEDSQMSFNDFLEKNQNAIDLMIESDGLITRSELNELNYINENLWAPDYYDANVGYFDDNGEIVPDLLYRHTDYLPVVNHKKICLTVYDVFSEPAKMVYFFYDAEKTLIEKSQKIDFEIGSTVTAIPETTKFVRFYAPQKKSGIKLKISFGEKETDFTISPLDLKMRNERLTNIDNAVENKTKFILHRGYHLNTNMYQENSIRSFEGAKGNYAVETDVRVTADGKFVCMHDATVDRTTTGNGKVSELTRQQLLAFNLKTPYPGEIGEENKQKIPTLEQFLEINRKNNTVPFLEIKLFNRGEDYDNFIDILRNYNMLDRACIISFDLEALQEIRNRDLRVKLQLVSHTISDELITKAKRLRNCDLSINFKNVTQELVGHVHDNDLKINVWSVNKKEDIDRMLNYGVDFVSTDETQAGNKVWRALGSDALNGVIAADERDRTFTTLRQLPDGMVSVESIIWGFKDKTLAAATPLIDNVPYWATNPEKSEGIWLGAGIGRSTTGANQITGINIVSIPGGTGRIILGFEATNLNWIGAHQTFFVGNK